MEEKFSVNDAVGELWTKLDGWLDAIILKLPNIVMAILVMVLFYFIARGVRRLLHKLFLHKISQVSIQEIIGRVVFLVIILIGFFVALGVLELDKVLTSILAGAGVVGLAIGLALQGTLNNTFGGLILSFLPKIKINDFIETGDTRGFVDEINLRSVVIRRSDNNYVIIPNSKFIDDPFTNYSISERSRLTVACGVGYESDLPKVQKITEELMLETFPQNEGEEIEFFFTEFGGSSIDFIVRFWVDVKAGKDMLSAKHKAVKAIKAKFDAENINIPFPIRTLDFGKNDMTVEVKNKQN